MRASILISASGLCVERVRNLIVFVTSSTTHSFPFPQKFWHFPDGGNHMVSHTIINSHFLRSQNPQHNVGCAHGCAPSHGGSSLKLLCIHCAITVRVDPSHPFKSLSQRLFLPAHIVAGGGVYRSFARHLLWCHSIFHLIPQTAPAGPENGHLLTGDRTECKCPDWPYSPHQPRDWGAPYL